MALKRIQDLDPATLPLDGTELLELEQAGLSVQASVADLLGLAALVDAVDDAAAALAGVAVGQMYRNGSVLMIRVV